MNDTPSEELLEELYSLSDLSKEFIQNGILCDKELQAVEEMEDILKSADKVRFTIYRIAKLGYQIFPF